MSANGEENSAPFTYTTTTTTSNAPGGPTTVTNNNNIYYFDTRDDTASNNPGPGRLVDNLYTLMGRGVDDFLGSLAHKLGYGPEAYAERIFSMLSNAPVPSASRQIIWGQACADIFQWEKCEYWTLFKYSTYDELSEKDKSIVRKRCKQIVKSIQSKTPSVQRRALESLIGLVTVFPSLQTVFNEQDAVNILAAMPFLLWSRGYSFKERDLLLGSSRRAMVSTEDSVINKFAKEYIAACSVPEDRRNGDWFENGYWKWADWLSDLVLVSSNADISRLVDQCLRHPVVRQVNEPNQRCRRCRGMIWLCHYARSVDVILDSAEGSYEEFYIELLTAGGMSTAMITNTFNEMSPLLPPIPVLPAEEWEDYIVSGEADEISYERSQTSVRLVREKYPHCEECEVCERRWEEWYNSFHE